MHRGSRKLNQWLRHDYFPPWLEPEKALGIEIRVQEIGACTQAMLLMDCVRQKSPSGFLGSSLLFMEKNKVK